jgi:hypothetical protein
MKKIAVAALAAITLSAQPAHATGWKCPQWRQLALDVGFTKRDWVTLDKILYRESRCRFYSTPGGEPDGNQGGFTE